MTSLITKKITGARLEREGRGLALRVGADPPQEPDAAQGREALPPLQQVIQLAILACIMDDLASNTKCIFGLILKNMFTLIIKFQHLSPIISFVIGEQSLMHFCLLSDIKPSCRQKLLHKKINFVHCTSFYNFFCGDSKNRYAP